ncbi:amino acid permease [Nicoliella spurrieriana]|uniref:Amino acid permease n=1 Tax=Nicoliella spurrieriana TaxID=2925830 RepID=A0A976RRX0_9LACO|nr:amino acid permease [Nicoliella spurrieriana]UQS86765.1 amino acid permease [Nicoliella spurrieriana]
MGQNDEQMSKELKERHVQLIALGGTIGTGLFLGAGQSIHFAGPSILLAYIIAGIACFFLMRALGELLMSNPDSTSYIDFIDKYLGARWGFIAGWTYWISWIAIAMAEITAAGLYMKFWFPSLPQWLPALLILIILFFLNSITVSAFGETEFWFAIIKVVAIIALIVVGVVLLLMHYQTSVGPVSLNNLTNGKFFANGAKGFFLSFQMVIFSFVGIEMIGMTASETKDPEKVIPKSINSVPTRILLFYIGSLLALMVIYPWNDISQDSSPFVQVFKNIGITSAAAIINFVVLTAAASACNSAIFTTGRMLYSLTGRESNQFSKRMHRLSKNKVPSNAILASTLVIAIAVILNIVIPKGVFTFIASVATTCFIFIWGAIVITHIKYRKQVKASGRESELEFKTPLFPASDYFVLAFLGMVAIVLLFEFDTLVALIGSIGWLIVIYIVYELGRKRNN